MRLSVAALLAFGAAVASAGIVITPVTEDQVVERVDDDCFFGVVTPRGCAYVSSTMRSSLLIRHCLGTLAGELLLTDCRPLRRS